MLGMSRKNNCWHNAAIERLLPAMLKSDGTTLRAARPPGYDTTAWSVYLTCPTQNPRSTDDNHR